MSLPHFAPFPDAKVRQNILPQEWHLYLESWTSLADLYLRLNEDQFSQALAETDSLSPFLISFFHALVSDNQLSLDAIVLRKKSFSLIHRLFSRSSLPLSLLTWPVLSDISHAFHKSAQFHTVLHSLWTRSGETIEKSLQTAKVSLARNLESKRPEEAENTLDRLAPLFKASPDANVYMFTGTDLADAVYSAYPKVPPAMQKKLVTMVYLGLTSVLEGTKPNYSLLSDHLYNYKTTEEQEQKNEPGKKTLVADLVTNTPFLEKIRDKATAPEAARLKNMAASLSAFRQSSIARPKRLVRRKVDKGKGKAEENSGLDQFTGEMHVHRMSIITQIQDLFPDLGAGFIVKLLDEYNEDIEQVTAHLLEDSLPPHLANADRSEQLYVSLYLTQQSKFFILIINRPSSTTPASIQPPRSSQTWERRNVFDGDEFDRLAIDPSRLLSGRKNPGLTADKILSDRSGAPNKSSILAALAAFDSDDDERDDTYDAEDVGASVDNAATGPDETDGGFSEKNEEILFRAYSTNPEVFGRDTETRKSQARIMLRNESNMTNEAIEGWGLMLQRDPKRFRRLEMKYSAFTGQQHELESTSWRDSPTASGDESGRGGRGGFPGRGRGRGRGRGGGRGGGNVAGPADDKGTQIARDRKDVNKASRANHNRKAARGKKMARAGFPS